MRGTTFFLTLLLATSALAGCMRDDEDDPPTVTPTPTDPPVTTTPSVVTPTPITTPPVTPTGSTLGPGTYQLATSGMPGQAKTGSKFNFTLYVNGSLERASDHVGAHYADNDTTNPPVAPGRRDCEHTAGELPDSFVVSCTIATPGAWYVWGHARIDDNGTLVNWWPATPSIVRVRDFNVTTSGAPTGPQQSRQNFTFSVNITGSENVTSDHIGAHSWNATTADPTVNNAAGACEHIAAGSIGNYTITCSLENRDLTPKTFYLRGHLRLVEGGTTLHWWGPEFSVTVLGNPLG